MSSEAVLIMLLPRTLLTLLNIFKDNYFSPRPVLDVPGVGRLRGSTVQSWIRQRDYQGYWGIPYGRAPLGDRRFLPPQPAPPLKKEFDAGQLSYVLSPRSCPQVSPAQSRSRLSLYYSQDLPSHRLSRGRCSDQGRKGEILLVISRNFS